MNLTNVQNTKENFWKWLFADQVLLTLLFSSQWEVEKFLEAEQIEYKEI